MPALRCRYCGVKRYLSNSLCHCAAESGGKGPVTGCHSTIEKPDSVSRVAPPTSTTATMSAAIARSQRRIARTCRAALASVMASPLEMDAADHIERPATRQSPRCRGHKGRCDADAHAQAGRHARALGARYRLGASRHGGRAIRVPLDQRACRVGLLRAGRPRLGAAGDAADQLDVTCRLRSDVRGQMSGFSSVTSDLWHLSSDFDAAEFVEDRGRGAREQHLDVAQLLILAVEADAGQRGQMRVS